MKDTKQVNTHNNLIDKIYEKQNMMSKSQKKIADFLMEHYDEAVYLTASRLAEAIGVSESTVVRFAMELGFEGYPQLKIALEEVVKTRLTANQRIDLSYNRKFGNRKDILKFVLQNDMEQISSTIDRIDTEAFDNVVNEIVKANKIYIVGGRSAYPLASFLSFYLNLMIENVIMTNSNSASELFEQILRINKGDLCICISFPRYSQKTVKAMAYANEKGAVTVAITDSVYSPIASMATHRLIAGSDIISFIDSLVAPMSVINALLVAVSLKKHDELSNTLDELENMWKEYQVYSSGFEHK